MAWNSPMWAKRPAPEPGYRRRTRRWSRTRAICGSTAAIVPKRIATSRIPSIPLRASTSCPPCTNKSSSGELAAIASGLNVDRVKILAFAISGMFAAIAGLLFSVKLSGGDANLANGFLLLAIVAVLVGGTPLTGGVGGVINTAIGTLIVMVIRAAMVYLEIDATQQQMVFGIVLIAAIALTIDRSKLRGVVK